MRRPRIWAAVVAVCVVILTADYIVARMHKTRDDKRVTVLQEQARSDHKFAKQLLDLGNAMTAERLARQARTKWIALVLIAASAVFLLAARKQLAGRGRKAVPLERIIREKAKPANQILPNSARTASQGIDLSFVDGVIEKEGRSSEAAIPILQAIQSHYRYLPDEALLRVCERTEITLAQIAGTSSFYSRFRTTPVGEHVVRVCHGTACHVSGARAITEDLRRRLHIPDDSDTDPQRHFTIEVVACLGCCSLAPVLMVDEQTAGKLTPAKAADALNLRNGREAS